MATSRLRGAIRGRRRRRSARAAYSSRVARVFFEAHIGSYLEDQAGRRPVDEQPTFPIRNSTFCGADATPSADHRALGRDRASLGCDRPQERYLELEGGRADATVEDGVDRKTHTGIEHRCCKPTMNGPSGI